MDRAREQYHDKLDRFGEAADAVLRFVVLSTIDEKWKDHLYDLDHLKASIGFRGWGQKDPLLEYKKEAYDMFEDLMTDMYAVHRQVRVPRAAGARAAAAPAAADDVLGSRGRRRAGRGRGGGADAAPAPQPRRPSLGVNPYAAVPPRPQPMRTNREETPAPAPAGAGQTVGRNDPCPCGSGKKYKQCHGRNA